LIKSTAADLSALADKVSVVVNCNDLSIFKKIHQLLLLPGTAKIYMQELNE
jgi:hypothetical protein